MNDNPLFAEQRRRNVLTNQAWKLFAPHRAVVMQHLLAAAPQIQSQLSVLGAGNCHDLDLSMLLGRYSAVQLVDIDDSAIKAGIQRQGLGCDSRIELLCSDVTGIGDYLPKLSPETQIDDPALRRCLSEAANETQQCFDVTASICLLTQLVELATLTLGPGHPAFMELSLRIRDQHLRSLVKSARGGGTAVLITDIVSSDTCPELLTVSACEVPNIVSRLINERNFFTGANPFAIQSFYQTDPDVSQLVAAVEVSLPWLWSLGNRSYAVAAVVVRRL
jgi:hypothetical protein